MSTEKSTDARFRNLCQKIPYESKKAARKSAKALSGRNGVRYKPHSCKMCGKWHIYSANLKQLKHNNQHSRGGRSSSVARKRRPRRRQR
jgi:hypothetical protein